MPSGWDLNGAGDHARFSVAWGCSWLMELLELMVEAVSGEVEYLPAWSHMGLQSVVLADV
jgi:hypothetical protein